MRQIPQLGVVGETALREAAATELRQLMGLVHAALALKVGASYVSVEAMYPDRVIVCRESRYFSYPYTVGEDNKVTLGDAQEVIEQYVPVRMAEASDSFLEAKDDEGRTWDAVLIRAGLSHNGTFYPDAVLREAATLFEGARVLARSDKEHLSGEGKDARNIVGWISGAKFVEAGTPDTGRVIGTFNFGAGASAVQLRDTITDAWKRGKRDLVGLSIDADGTAGFAMRESKRVRVAKSIKKVNSVDLIVEPSAGGALVRLVEAAADNTREQDPMKERLLAAIKAKAPKIFAKINAETVTDAELEAHYSEAVREELTAATATALPPVTGGLTAEQVTEQIRMVESRGYMRSTIAASNLPLAAKEKVASQFATLAKFTEADVDAAITAERAYLAKFTESGHVRVPFDQATVEDRSVKVNDMLDAFFDPAHKDHRAAQSFKECYAEITGDRRVTGRLADMDRVRLAEAAGASFRESLESTTFSNVLGDAVSRRLLADYRLPNVYSVWRPLVSVVPASDFRTQHRTRFGGYGDLPAVAQGAPYASLTSPTDEEATYAVSKRGGTEDVTLEMVKNDDVAAIRQIPTKLSRSAARTLGKFVLDFIRTNPTLYDGVAFFHATHANLGSAALDATSLAAARLRVLKLTEAGSSERIAIPPKNLIVSVDLEEGAVNLFNRNTNNDKTFVNAMTLQIIPVWYWTDANDWALGVDPMDIPSIEVGFLDGQEEPELFTQDMPNVGSMFTNDKITYKIRHIYGGQVVNFRGYDKSVVA